MVYCCFYSLSTPGTGADICEGRMIRKGRGSVNCLKFNVKFGGHVCIAVLSSVFPAFDEGVEMF